MQLYPASPSSVEVNYTKLPSSYYLKVTLAIMAILLFFVLYFTMVLILGYLVKWSIFYPIENINKLTILGKIGAIGGSIMLFVFTLKFIFKIKNHQPENRIKLNENENPKLWNFVQKICKETGAPKPKNIYVDPDVNAYVSYSNSWLSLIWPVKKDLTIGLGLVSCLNLSEFKAVVSHEFGHFAQRSMTIGSYIMSANTIIQDMIFGRDSWDDALDNWRSMDLRLSFAAWIITPIIWVIRQVLNLFYKFLNLMYSSLSREMEFNADRVAAKTSGSESIVSALWKLDFGAQEWNSTIHHLYNANKKGLNLKNIYEHHQEVMEEKGQGIMEVYETLEAHPKGGKQFFISDENSKVGMYASHPPNNSREENVKSPFLACELDDRSPWLLFEEADQVQTECTQTIYQQYFDSKVKDFASVDNFKKFVLNESKGQEMLSKFQNTYTDRFIDLNVEDLNNTESLSDQALIDRSENLKNKLTQLHDKLKAIDEKIGLFHQVVDKKSKVKTVDYNGITYKKKNIDEGYNIVAKDRLALINDEFSLWDRKNYTICKVLNDRHNIIPVFEKLIHQHKVITQLFRNFIDTRSQILEYLNHLQENDQITEDNIYSVTGTIAKMGRELNEHIEGLNLKDFIPLSNVDSFDEFLVTIVPNGKLTPPKLNMFGNNSYNIFMQEVEQAIGQLNRIDQKSIAIILEKFEDILRVSREKMME